MIKKILITTITYLFLMVNLNAAGSDGGDSGGSSAAVKTNYDKAVSHIKIAKKHEKKGKLDKAKERYLKAQKLLIKSNSKKPNKADTLNYLGFTTRKLGDFEMGEKYYLQGLAINPNHKGINEYLGVELNILPRFLLMILMLLLFPKLKDGCFSLRIEFTASYFIARSISF